MTIPKLELIGFYIIFLTGFFLHSSYNLFGNPRWLAPFVPVNESVWEHLKMAAWSTLIYAAFEFPFLYNNTSNFFLAKSVSIITIPLIIMILHYSYKLLIGHHIVILDIIIFAFAIYIGQIISTKILSISQPLPLFNYLAIISVVILFFAFSYLTFYPLKLPIFLDSSTGKYGLTN